MNTITFKCSCLMLLLLVAAPTLSPLYIQSLVSAVLSVTTGLVIKLALEWDRNKLTFKSAITQSAFSMGIGYITFFWLDGNKFMGMRQEVVLAIASLSAAYFVSGIDNAGKKRARGFIDGLLDRVLGKKKYNQDDQ